MFNLLNDAAINLPSSQGVIISLILDIQKLLDLEIPEADYMPVEHGDVFKNLPNFVEGWSDQLNRMHNPLMWALGWGASADQIDSFNVAHNKKAATREGERNGKEWSAVTAFTARLAACPNQAINSRGYFLGKSYDDIVLALEYDNMNINTSIPATANWFLYAGENIFQQVVDGADVPGGGLKGKDIWSGLFKTGGLSEGEGGLSLGRWRVWRARFKEVVEDENVWEETRTAAQHAVETMVRIENRGN